MLLALACLAAFQTAVVPNWHSAVRLDPNVQPRAKSTLPGYENGVEQCGEFAFRYFRSQGKGYPTLGQPLFFLQSGKDHNGGARPAFGRFMNGTTEPPRAGDILVCKGPRPGQFHTAIIEKVDDEGVHVFQSNVPHNWRGGKHVKAVYPLVLRNGVYKMPPLPTSQAGYRDDFAVTGWIRPTGRDALPPT